MNTHTVTIEIPTSLYERLRDQATQSDRSIEAELVEVVSHALPVDEPLSPQMTQLLQDLSLLNDHALWQSARSHLSKSASEQMEALHHKRQREALTPSEQEVLTTLLAQYERYMVVRAQAAVLLKQRGHDISKILE